MKYAAFIRCLVFVALAVHSADALDLIPTPRFVEALNRQIAITGAIKVHSGQPDLAMAHQMLTQSWPDVSFAVAETPADADIVLWNYAEATPPTALNYLEKRTLELDPLRDQGYVVKMDGDTMWVLGGGRRGVQYGAATVAQLLHVGPQGIRLDAAVIRDAPDFQYRAASDWLLAVELNRWSFDRGRGFDDYAATARAKLDRSARYKINMALVDGFGWSFAKRPPEYPGVMRGLNRYARERGIRLLYGGYGAAYDLASRPAEYHGEVHLNRESYPDGKVYECLTYPNGKPKAGTLGTCRGNDDLNRAKGEELAHFVDEVEPGGLYIHHEDCCVFEDFQKAWLGRCERCRKRWPNDSLKARDGGAGALAHGYSALIDAVNHVKHDDFDASRDTEIIIVSPVYMPASTSSDEWSNVLELWKNITAQMTKAKNVQICFRETMPQPGGGSRWIEIFQSMMKEADLPFGAFVFFAGGAEGFMSNYPMSGTPAMTAHFAGARSIYHSTGDFYVEPMELVAAEYAWNVHSSGFFRNPTREADIDEIARWMHTPGEPPEIFGEGQLFDRICSKLYGVEAGKLMSRFYGLRQWLPDVAEAEPNADGKHAYYHRRTPPYLRRVFDYVTALPTHWNYMNLEAASWAEPSASVADRETHRRRARLWRIAVEMNSKGKELVAAALASKPRPEAVADIEFLLTLFDVQRPLLGALRDFHTAQHKPDASGSIELLAAAHQNAVTAHEQALQKFPNPIDPALGEVRSLIKYSGDLAAAIERAQEPGH